MTHPDPQLADSIGNWLGGIAIAAWMLWRRRAQNNDLASDIDESLKRRVNKIESALGILQDMVGIHSERIKEGNEIAEGLRKEFGEMRSELASNKEVVERGEALVKQFNDYLERAKAGTLVEKPLPGGMTKLETKKGT